MTRYLLDTNILTEPLRPQPSPTLENWMAAQAGDDLFIATLTVAELRRGVLQRPPGRRRQELEDWFSGSSGPEALFAGRILAFDLAAAMAWARLMADGTALGRPRSAIDMMIAAVAVANHCVVASANERHFNAIVPFINPLRERTAEA